MDNVFFKRILKSRNSMVGLGLIIMFALVALLAPVISPPESRNPYQVPQKSYEITPSAPSAQHIFGTTEQQYDIFYAVIWGTRMAFKIGITVTFIAFIIGMLIGGTAAYCGGWVDEILMRITDSFFAIPSIVLAMFIAAMLGPETKNMVIALSAVAWPSYARLIRGDVLSVKDRDYVKAARVMGAGNIRIFFKHIIPNSIYPSVVVASLDIGYIVLIAASLSFLGLGAPQGSADWGQLISMSRSWVLGTPHNPFAYAHTIIFPGLAIFLFVFAWNLLGDAFRDVLDPRQK
ncbi:ABC transporter permease [Parelusimicrobium proximum]|uniref:ABC transporter permease n=1 Tax=Parelusimicrobium proximum TaxID=3228953 RepID=UPI003D1743EF